MNKMQMLGSKERTKKLEAQARKNGNMVRGIVFALLCVGGVWVAANQPASTLKTPPAAPTQIVDAPAPTARVDKYDALLKNRDTMVAAVATLMVLPTNCTVDKKHPDAYQVARFVYTYGHGGNADAFEAAVKAKLVANEVNFKNLSPSVQAEVTEGLCGWGVILTGKVRDANK
jgi:hypothetical protein